MALDSSLSAESKMLVQAQDSKHSHFKLFNHRYASHVKSSIYTTLLNAPSFPNNSKVLTSNPSSPTAPQNKRLYLQFYCPRKNELIRHPVPLPNDWKSVACQKQTLTHVHSHIPPLALPPGIYPGRPTFISSPSSLRSLTQTFTYPEGKWGQSRRNDSYML